MTHAGVRPRDGGAVRPLPGSSLNVGGPALDRFLVLRRSGDRLSLHDLGTNRTADLGIRSSSAVGDSPGPDSLEAVTMNHTTRYVLANDHADERVVINLPAIR